VIKEIFLDNSGFAIFFILQILFRLKNIFIYFGVFWMNSRERVLAAINHEVPDRIPTDIWATPEVWSNLRAYFGENVDIMETLHIDGIAWLSPKYVGPKLFANGEWKVDYWGVCYKLVSYGNGLGVYEEPIDPPLAHAKTIKDLDAYQWPKVDWFNFSEMRKEAKKTREKRVIGAGYMAVFYQHCLLRGFKNALLDPIMRPEFTRHLLDLISGFLYELHVRIFEECDGLIDVTQVTDDLGTQNGPMISLKIFRDFYRPHMKKFIDLAHGFGIKVFHHDDGAIRIFIPELVEMGIDILNPVQWTCPGMDLEELKREFGDHLCFHGAIDNQRILSFATPEQVRAEVRRCIDILASDGTGYILAPCHNIQPISPIENIIAMYDEAYKYGSSILKKG